MKVVLCLLIACVFSIANATNYKDEHTLPTDSQDLIITYMKRADKYRNYLSWMCTGFDFSQTFAPNFSFPVDEDYWYEKCWYFSNQEGYFVDFMRKYRANLIKEVREEFKKEGKH